MNVNDYILKEIKALTPKSTVEDAQELCEGLPITHIPIVENNKLIGCFSEDDIRPIENLNVILNEYSYLLQHFYADEKTSLLELISLFAEYDSNLIPVLDKEQNYIGYYELSDILDAFADCPFLHRDNETLVIEKPKNDFSMSQVTQIVESNKAKLLGLYVSQETMDAVRVTLKISTQQMNEIIQTFRRYDYSIVTQHIDDEYLEELKERAGYFKKYLEI